MCFDVQFSYAPTDYIFSAFSIKVGVIVLEVCCQIRPLVDTHPISVVCSEVYCPLTIEHEAATAAECNDIAFISKCQRHSCRHCKLEA